MTGTQKILGRDLKEGVRVKTWFMPKGTAVISSEPYRGPLGHLWPDQNVRILGFNAITQSGSLPMTVADEDIFELA